MLLEFSVGNFRSINEVVTLSLQPILPASKQPECILGNDRYKALKCAVLYGANASGKSNFLKAMDFFKTMVKSSVVGSPAIASIDVQPFKLSEDQNPNSYFEIVFVEDDIKYRYGFEASTNEVVNEWCFIATKNKEYPLFLREYQNIDVRDRFKEGKTLESKTRPNALFLSVVSQFNGAVALTIVNWISKKFNSISGLDDITYLQYSARMLEDKDMRSKIMTMLKAADTDINNIHYEEEDILAEKLPAEIPDSLKEILLKSGNAIAFRLSTEHHVHDKKNNVVGLKLLNFGSEESEGTKKFFSLTGPILNTLRDGKVLIIDELDARLHPILTNILVKMFNSEWNQNGAQLIFATHDTNLLSSKVMRRDQIWFVEKERQQSSHIYSLAEYKIPGTNKKERQDAIWSKEYIQGRYGAIPFVGSINDLFETA